MDSTSTKARLLEAATQVFLAHGFAAASMDLVRQEAGVSNGSLYHHFPTKSQLADALYAQLLRDMHTALFMQLGPRVGAQNGVKALVRGYVQWVLQHPAGARLLHELRRTGALADSGEWTQANAEGFARLGQWIDAKTEAGEMREVPFPVWNALVFGPAVALTPGWLAKPEPAVPAKVRAALEHAAWMAVAP